MDHRRTLIPLPAGHHYCAACEQPLSDTLEECPGCGYANEHNPAIREMIEYAEAAEIDHYLMLVDKARESDLALLQAADALDDNCPACGGSGAAYAPPVMDDVGNWHTLPIPCGKCGGSGSLQW